MANRDIVDGAKPYGPCLRSRPYIVAAVVYPGDLLKFTDAGKVTKCSATDASMGVALTYAAADGATVLVADHPDQEFVMQVDDATVDALTDMNLNYDLAIGSANATYKRSGIEIDGDTGSTDADPPIKILRALPAVDNALGANVKVICKINNHQLGNHTGTAGV